MDLTTITVQDFKSQFFRGFPYLPTYNPSQLYNIGNEVYQPSTLLFYICQQNGVTGIAPPSAPWTQVPDDTDNYVQDQDIMNAFSEAQINLNQGLFSSDANITLGYLYLTAHYLVNDLRASQSGIAGIGQQPLTGRSVANVSEQYGIPQKFLNSPILAFYITSAYGLKFLSMILPKLQGNIAAIPGAVAPDVNIIY